MNCSIYGAGAWGTAMAVHLQRQGHTVTLVSRRVEHAAELATCRENRDYLPGHRLEPALQIASMPGPALLEAEVLLLACPTAGLRALCGEISTHLATAKALKMLVVLCKGMEPATFRTPVEMVAELLPGVPCGVLSGPTYAEEVAAGKPTAIVLAAGSQAPAEALQQALSGPSLRVYLSTDMRGVALAGCLKNIYAIGAGVCAGLRLGDNAKAAYLTRALHEMVRLGTALGGQPTTFYGLGGFGDLVATCSGSWSRNRSFGEALAAGGDPQGVLASRKTVVEGYAATLCFAGLCEQRGIEAPILKEIHAVLTGKATPADAIQSLMSRDLRAES